MNEKKSITSDERQIVLIICLITALIAFGAKAIAGTPQKVDKSLPKQERTPP